MIGLGATGTNTKIDAPPACFCDKIIAVKDDRCTDISHIKLGPDPNLLPCRPEIDAMTERLIAEVHRRFEMPENQGSNAVLRAKLRVTEVSRTVNAEGSYEQERVKLSAVYSSDPSSENAQWSKWTPSADFSLNINNQGAFGKLPLGTEFYIDFIPAVAESVAAAGD